MDRNQKEHLLYVLISHRELVRTSSTNDYCPWPSAGTRKELIESEDYRLLEPAGTLGIL